MARVNEITNAFEEIVPPSASASASSSTPSKKVPCDVFINHRGPDAKHTLATSIYRKLKLMGLEVFLDEPELELGDFIPAEIQDAMTTSFLHIAILSPTYAESPWCLAELSFMLKTDKKVIPVFYNVEPGDVRWIEKGKGIYAVAFSKHEKSGRYTSEKLQEWKLALQNVSYLRGHIVKENESLERLKANTWWKVPLIQNLEHMESLRTLELSAWNISAFEPCLKTIKKWPSECIICARAARGMEAILKSCTFPGLTMVDSCVQKKYGLGEKLTLKCGQRSSSSAVLCFVINSVTYISLNFFLGEKSISQIQVNEGKWVWMGVFTQLPPLEWEEEFVLYKDFMFEKSFLDFSYEKDMGLLLMGEERRVLTTFYKLLQYLGRYENV